MATTDWNPILRGEFDKPYWRDLQQFVTAERQRHTVYPSHPDVFAALHLTPSPTRVLILGQDPYHGAGQAHGLCFSVANGMAIPPSLANIHASWPTTSASPCPATGTSSRGSGRACCS
jgi:uracil-DNA glycosylase